MFNPTIGNPSIKSLPLPNSYTLVDGPGGLTYKFEPDTNGVKIYIAIADPTNPTATVWSPATVDNSPTACALSKMITNQ